MRFLRGSNKPVQEAPAGTAAEDRRRTYRRCASCRVAVAALLHCDNGLDYCERCFERVQGMMPVVPVGRRADDAEPQPWDSIDE